jgi:hypothetical protein
MDNTVGSYSTWAPVEDDVSMSDLGRQHRLYIDHLAITDGRVHAPTVRLEPNTLALVQQPDTDIGKQVMRRE